jgi:hypothetical protein
MYSHAADRGSSSDGNVQCHGCAAYPAVHNSLDRVVHGETPGLVADEDAQPLLRPGCCRSTIDLLICSVAYRRDWQIFTTDRDFGRYDSVLGVKLHGAGV